MSTTLERIGELAVHARIANKVLRKAFDRYDKEKASGKDHPTSYDPERISFLRATEVLNEAIDAYLAEQEAVHVEG
jgi:hypothetical protein